MTTDPCVFCKIIERQIPAEILYENDHAIAILDIRPIHYGHSLIIPKKHCASFLEVPEEAYFSILQAAAVITRALVQTFRLEGYNLFSNNGTVAGQSVFHFHLHVTPRYGNDNIRFQLELKKYTTAEMEQTAQLLRTVIEKIVEEHKTYGNV